MLIARKGSGTYGFLKMALQNIHKRSIIALIILSILIAGYSLKDPLYNQLAAWNILQKPDNITELYFTQPSSVPSVYTPAHPITTTFTIRNNTNTPKTYRYILNQQNEAGDMRQELQTGTVTVPLQSEKDIQVQIIPVDFGVNTQFTIQLADQTQQINFWATKS